MRPPSSTATAPVRAAEREQELAEAILRIWHEDLERQMNEARERGWEQLKTQIRRQAVNP